MTISSIADLLAAGWDHAWCAEGPSFSIPSAVSGWAVGSVAIGGSSGFVETWPDEIGTADLTSAGAGSGGIYTASNPAFNGKPTVDSSENVNGNLLADFTDIAQPFQAIAVCRRPTLQGAILISFSNPGALTSQQSAFGENFTTNYTARTGTTVRTGGTPDTNAHCFDFRGSAGTGAYLDVDGVNKIGFLASGSAPLGAVALFGDQGRAAQWKLEIAFLGVRTGISSTLAADVLAFSQSHWSTP